jgi:CheY-like chemotaxis protein
MDGFEFLEHWQCHSTWKNIPVVIYTSRDLTTHELKRLNQHCDAVLIKGRDNTQQIIQSVLQSASPVGQPVAGLQTE